MSASLEPTVRSKMARIPSRVSACAEVIKLAVVNAARAAAANHFMGVTLATSVCFRYPPGGVAPPDVGLVSHDGAPSGCRCQGLRAW